MSPEPRVPSTELRLRRAFAIAAIAWAAAIPFAAWLASRPAASTIGYAFTALVYKAGSLVCHQRPERSFQLSAMPLPVCARCTGIYFGGAIAAITAIAVSRRPPAPRFARRRAAPTRSEGGKPAACRWDPVDPARAVDGRAMVAGRTILLAAALPTALTLTYEWTTGVMPSNAIRALAGAPIGAGVAWLIAILPEVN